MDSAYYAFFGAAIGSLISLFGIVIDAHIKRKIQKADFLRGKLEDIAKLIDECYEAFSVSFSGDVSMRVAVGKAPAFRLRTMCAIYIPSVLPAAETLASNLLEMNLTFLALEEKKRESASAEDIKALWEGAKSKLDGCASEISSSAQELQEAVFSEIRNMKD